MPRFIINPADGGVPNVRQSLDCCDLPFLRSSRHQWIFVTDTVYAVYRPDDWNPEAMMDQLSEIVGNLPVPEARVRWL